MNPAFILDSSISGEYNHFFWLLTAICGTVGIGIAAFLIFCAWRYRRRDPNELPPQIKRYIPAEIAWIGIPTLIFMGMFLYGVKLYFDIERPPDNAQIVYVVAKQWMWKLQHVDCIREINELHVAVGQSIELRMISQDVIHSFYVPDFRVKQDVLPGRYTTLWFRATRPGAYHLFCAEYCGTNHSQMHGWIYVLSPSEYERWIQQGGAEGSLADTGEKLFHQFACANCHHYSGHGPGPNLTGLYAGAVQLEASPGGIADDEYLRKSILQPNAQIAYGFHASIMPTFQGQLTEEQVIALIAYIKALGARPIEDTGAQSARPSGNGPANSAAEPEPASPAGPNRPGGK